MISHVYHVRFPWQWIRPVKDNPERRRAVFIIAAGVHRLKKNGIVVKESATKKWPPLGRFYCSVTLLVGPENGHTFRARETYKKIKKCFLSRLPASFSFVWVVLPSVSLSWHPHGDIGSTTWEYPKSFSYRLLLGQVCEEAHDEFCSR